MNTSYIQWCNENEGRKFPIAETATAVSSAGQMLPSDIIADLQLMVPPTYTNVRVSAVWVTRDMTSIAIVADEGPLAFAICLRAGYRPYTAVALQPMPGVANVSGHVVFGAYRFVSRQHWLFDNAGQSGLDISAMKLVAPLPVTSMRKLGDASNEFVDQLVTLLGGGNSKVYAHETDEQTIVVEITPASARSAFLGPCFKSAERGDCPVPAVRKINNVCGDQDGILTLVIK